MSAPNNADTASQPSYTHGPEFTATEVAALGGGFRALGDSYEQLGVTFAEAGAAILALQATGMSPGVAGRGLRNLIEGTSSPNASIAQHAARLGVTPGRNTFLQHGLLGTIERIARPAMETGNLDDLVGSDAASIARTLLENRALYDQALSKFQSVGEDSPVSTIDAFLRWAENVLLDDPVSTLMNIPLAERWLKRLYRWVKQGRAHARRMPRGPGVPRLISRGSRELARRLAGWSAAVAALPAGAWSALRHSRGTADADGTSASSPGGQGNAFSGVDGRATVDSAPAGIDTEAPLRPRHFGTGRAGPGPLDGPFSAGARRGPDALGKLNRLIRKWAKRAFPALVQEMEVGTQWLQELVNDRLEPAMTSFDEAIDATAEWWERALVTPEQRPEASPSSVSGFCDQVITPVEQWSDAMVTDVEQWCGRMVTNIEKALAEATRAGRTQLASHVAQAATWADETLVRIDAWLQEMTRRDPHAHDADGNARSPNRSGNMLAARYSAVPMGERALLARVPTSPSNDGPVLVVHLHGAVYSSDDVTALIAQQLNRAIRSAGYVG